MALRWVKRATSFAMFFAFFAIFAVKLRWDVCYSRENPAGGRGFWFGSMTAYLLSASCTLPTMSGPGWRVASPSSFHLEGQPSVAFRDR